MRVRVPRPLTLALILALGIAIALAQESNPPLPGRGSSHGGGQRTGGAGWGGLMMGRGVIGTVTEVAADHYSVKTEAGELYTVHYSVNTRIMKGGAMRGGRDDDGGPPANPPQRIKPTDIRVGDAIAASGEVDPAAKSIGAVFVIQIDPERAKQMREMQANYGKTWLMGRVTAINELTVTVQGGPDNATRTFTADENTTFRKHREPITLGDIHVGEIIRVEGAMKSGVFLATIVAVMGPPPGGPPDRSPDSTVFFNSPQ